MTRRSIPLAWASTLGITRDELAESAGLGPTQLASATWDDEASARVWDALERLTGDPLVGLHAGEALRVDELGPVGPAFVHAATVGAAIAALVRLVPQLMRGVIGERVDSPEGGGLRYQTTQRRSRHGADAVLAAVLSTLRDSSRVHLVPTLVQLEAPAPRELDPHTRFFGVRPVWGASANAILFAPADLTRPLRGSAPALSELLIEQASVLLAKDRGVSRLEHEIEDAFWLTHRSRNATLASVAHTMSVSPRTLQRRLSEQGLVFTTLRDQLLKLRAHDLLRDETLSIDGVADALGYGSRGSFERAFQRWYGVSAAAARARHRR